MEQKKSMTDDKEVNTDEHLTKHQKMMNNAGIEVDSTIFGNIHRHNAFDKCASQNCISLKRLITASTYYSKLDIIENDTHHALFDDFIHNIYVDLINDYIHFNNQHSYQIEQINN
eukprot:506820_1